MFRNKGTLLILLLLPFIIGSSNSLQPNDEQFTINNNSVFSPGSKVQVSLYTYDRIHSDFSITLFKIEDVEAFYSGVLHSNYNFDVIGKEILFKYTRKIKDWGVKILPNNYYSQGNLSLGTINEPGIYIVQALKGSKVAYCPVVVSNYSMVYKTTRSQILAFTQNVKTGEFLKDVNFTYIQGNEKVSSKSDSTGIGLIKFKPFNERVLQQRSILLVNTGEEVLVSNPYIYHYGMRRDISAYTYTNQPVYRPGQQVFFKTIIREKSGNDLKNVSGEVFNVTIKSTANKEVYKKDLTTNETGSLWGDFFLDEDASLGEYSIYIKQGESSFYGSFSVEEYKKPEYEVKVNIPKTNYSNKDIIEGTVNADYYFGSPVSKGTVSVKIYKQHYWRPWWYFSEYSWFYSSYEKVSYYNWREMQLINTIEGTLDENGQYKFSYEVNENNEADYNYVFTADVVDASRRSISGTASTLITRGSFALFTSPDKYFIELGKPVTIRVNAADFNNKPIQTDFKVVFTYSKEYRGKYTEQYHDKDSITGRTDTDGKSMVSYIPKYGASGYYTYEVSAKDEKGRLITSQGSFYYGERWYYNYSWGEGVQIITDKDTYKKGDSLTAYIFLPDSTTEFLLTYESNEIFYYKKEFAKGNSITIKEKLDDRFAPSFNISVTYMKNDKFYQHSKSVGVLAEDKFLKVTIAPDKKLYKPSDNASYVISIKDYFGKPVPKTDISVGLIDEAIYSIKEESGPDITSFFYAPVYSWVPTNNSYYYNYSSGQSRLVNAIDKYFFNLDKKNQKGNGNLYGGALNSPNQKLTGSEIILLNEDNFYSTSVDTGGNYRFTNIVTGKYQMKVYGSDGIIFQNDEVKVEKNSKYDILINSNDSPNNQIFSMSEPGGRSSEAIILSDNKMPMKAVSSVIALTSGVVNAPAVTRSHFVDAAFWAPSLMTNSEGKVTVNFKMPDNLTKWRTTVRGMTASSLTGQDTIKTITSKDLIVRMETPRFFREGDELTISTMVHNYLDQKKRTRISFKSDNLKLIESQINTPGYSTNLYDQKAGMYELTIEKNTELRIDWRVLVLNGVDSIKLNAEALTDKESDAIELKVPLLPKGLKRVVPVIAEVDNQNEQVVSFYIPEDVDLKSAKFMFNTSPSLSGTMLKALDELAGYPYGCVEQTMSRFLPTIIATNAFKQLDVPLKSSTVTELPKMVNEGLKKLYGYQQADNGWGWWGNGESSPYITAYVVYGLAMCKDAGYPLNESVLDRGISKLSTQFEDPKIDETTAAYMIYSLSTAAKGKYDDMLMKRISVLNKEKLNSYSLALVTLALLNLDHKKEAEASALLLAGKASTENGLTTWKRPDWNYCWYSDDVQTTAFALKALINSGVKNEIVSNGVKWLLLQRRGFYWRSTQETAAIIFMLTDYLKQTKELNPDYNVKVYLNDQLAYEKRITGEDIYNEPEVIRFNSNLKSGTNNVRIVKEGKGKVYFSGVNEFFTKETSASGNEGKFNVAREFYLLKPIQKEGRIIYRKEYLDGEVKSGDDILVKTTVTTSLPNPEYFMLEDMLPSGIEVVKDLNKYEIEGENDYRPYDYYGYRPWRWFYSNREYRDEKVSFFVTYGSQKMEFSYIIKAQIPGNYSIMPSQASLMYYPEINGNSSGYETIIKD